MSSITVEVYSEKAIVVRNTLEHHGPVMEQLGGTFNEKLKGGRGWIFSKYKMTQVRNIIEKLNSGQYGNEYEQKSSSVSSVSVPQVESVSKTEFLSVLSRVERLEALVSNLCAVMSGSSTTPMIVPSISTVPPMAVVPSVSTVPPMAVVPSTQVSKPIFSKPVSKSRIEDDIVDFDDLEDPPVERKRMVAIKK